MDAEPSFRLDLSLRVGTATLRADVTSSARAIAVVGPSGAGKSTLLRVVAGLERRARGLVRIGGRVLQDGRVFVPPWERGAAWVPQDALLFPHLTAAENLSYAGARGDDVREVAEALGLVPLLDRRPRNLSGGERQRVALARALLADARFLLLDEPFSALDRKLRSSVASWVAERARARNLPVVLVSHDDADVERIAGERWIVEDGEVRRDAK